jgi:hypothetical protein
MWKIKWKVNIWFFCWEKKSSDLQKIKNHVGCQQGKVNKKKVVCLESN